MKNFKERQRDEALKILELLTKKYNLNDEPVKIFKKGEYGITSQTTKDLDGKQLIKIIREFEEKYDSVVFYTIITPFIFGTVINMLYISKYEEDWHLSIPTNDDFIYAATYNLDDHYLERGFIKIEGEDGVLARIS